MQEAYDANYLARQPGGPPRQWCIFTSVGDAHSVQSWLPTNNQRKWDLIVSYYGESETTFNRLAEQAEFAIRTKGGKFQNLKKLIDQHPNMLDQYEFVCVCDDDIIMSAGQIEQFFSIAQTFGFWVSQPSFSAAGKWSHEITVHAGRRADFRIVNFVENTMPVFRRDKLVEFLSVYDGSLVGYGIDLWFMTVFEANTYGRFAIIDSVQVINPINLDKGWREIDRLQSYEARLASWHEVSRRFGVTGFPHKVFAYCVLAQPGDSGARSITNILVGTVKKARTLLRIANRNFRSKLARP